MSSDDPAEAHASAVEQLISFGLSTYAARTFAALVGLGGGTAREVDEAAEVPRTRVYDAVTELEEHGLVETEHSSPKQFWPVSAETTGRQFRRDYARKARALTEALEDLEPNPGRDTDDGVWTVSGQAAITDCVREFIDAADEALVFVTDDDHLTGPVVDRLRTASERGVAVRLGGVSGAAKETVRQDVPDVAFVEPTVDWAATPACRLLLVDRERTLASVHSPERGDGTDDPVETGICGAGKANGLVTVLRALVAIE